MDYRCEHMNIEIGSINEILSDNCVHMNNHLRRKRKLQNQNFKKQNHMRKNIQKLFSSSSDDSSEYISEDTDYTDFKISYIWKNSAKNLNDNIDEDDILFQSKQSEAKNEENFDATNITKEKDFSLATLVTEKVCEEDFNDFRNSFDILLKQHCFMKVPGLKDYFFYWPQSLAIANFEELIDSTLEGKI